MSRKKDEETNRASGEPREIPVGSPEETPGTDETSRPAEAAESPTPEQQLQVKCAQLEARATELEDQHLRALAELDNYKKRMARQFEDTVRSANDRLLVELLEVVDNFERALAHSKNGDGGGTTNHAALREGTELIYNQVQNLLAKYGVRPIEAVGRKFDPNFHEALMEMDSAEHDAGIVAQELTRGYMIEDRVLRHSRVAVSRGAAKDEK